MGLFFQYWRQMDLIKTVASLHSVSSWIEKDEAQTVFTPTVLVLLDISSL